MPGPAPSITERAQAMRTNEQLILEELKKQTGLLMDIYNNTRTSGTKAKGR